MFFISALLADWRGIVGLTQVRQQWGGCDHCYLVEMPTSTFKSIFRKCTSGPLLYQIAAHLGDVKGKKNPIILLKAVQVKTKLQESCG